MHDFMKTGGDKCKNTMSISLNVEHFVNNFNGDVYVIENPPDLIFKITIFIFWTRKNNNNTIYVHQVVLYIPIGRKNIFPVARKKKKVF